MTRRQRILRFLKSELSLKQKLIGYAVLGALWGVALLATGGIYWTRVRAAQSRIERLHELVHSVQDVRLAERDYLRSHEERERRRVKERLVETRAILDELRAGALTSLLDGYRDRFAELTATYLERRQASQAAEEALATANASVDELADMLAATRSERQMDGGDLSTVERELAEAVGEVQQLLLRLRSAQQAFLLTGDDAELAGAEQLLSGNAGGTMEALSQFARVLKRKEVTVAAERLQSAATNFSQRARRVQALFVKESKAVAALEAAGSGIIDRASALLAENTEAARGSERLAVRILLALLAGGGAVFLGLALVLLRLITDPVQVLARAASALGEGRLNHAIDLEGRDELGALAHSFRQMAEGLRAMVADLRNASAEVEHEAASLLATSTSQSSMVSQQAAALQETSATSAEIAQTADQASAHADSVVASSRQAEELARAAQDVAEHSLAGLDRLSAQVLAMAKSIGDLAGETSQIATINQAVADLADQSHVLAINAAIEAASAGAHGRGFAVVAEEMRRLASQSKEASDQVNGILLEIQRRTRSTAKVAEEGSHTASEVIALARRSGETIQGVGEAIRAAAAAARQIAESTRQQTAGVQQIVSAIDELSSAGSEVVAGTRSVESAAGRLTKVSSRLGEVVGRYRT